MIWSDDGGGKEKVRGCGGVQESGRGCEVWLEALTENDLEDRYDSNQSRAVPEMPNQEESPITHPITVLLKILKKDGCMGCPPPHFFGTVSSSSPYVSAHMSNAILYNKQFGFRKNY